MELHFILVATCLLFASAFEHSDNSLSRDLIRRMDELESRDRSQQAELEELRKHNNALVDEVTRLLERDIQHTSRIEVLEERERQLTDIVDILMSLARDGALKHQDKGDKGGTRFQSEDVGDIDNAQRVVAKEFVSEEQGEQVVDSLDEDDHEFGEKKTVHSVEQGARYPTPNHNRIRQIDQEVSVAFFATMTNHTYHLGHFQTIVFDNAITNVGHAYHTTSGVFFAPVSGIYVFSATIMMTTHTAHFEYTVNGKFMSHMFTDSRSAYETTSQTVVFSLTQGDEVTLRNVETDIWLHGNHYNSFTGFLLSLYYNADNSQIVG